MSGLFRNSDRRKTWRQRHQQHVDEQLSALVEQHGRRAASIIAAAERLAARRNDNYRPANWHDAALYLIEHKENTHEHESNA